MGMARRGVVLTALALAACGPSTPVRTSFPPLTFDYLTRLRLNVATIDIDDAWQAPPNPREVGAYAPVPPVVALRQMAVDRLGAGGTSGRAVFTILDASLLNRRDRVDGSFGVRLAVTTADGTRSAYAEARVARSMTLIDDDPATLRDALYTLVRQAMDDMNVEFEYQVRRTLRDWLQTTSGAAPVGAPVQSQDLAPPPGIQAAPGVPMQPLPAPQPGPQPTPLFSPPPTTLTQPPARMGTPITGTPDMGSDPD
jgi:hypothetical protein